MTRKNKKILWSIAGATVAALIIMYLFVTPVHNWVNSVIGKKENTLPKPGDSSSAEFEYGKPVEVIETETIDVPRDSILDSLMRADTAHVGVVRPIDGPQPAHVEGFGEGPLPPAPTEENIPNKEALDNPELNAPTGQVDPNNPEEIVEIEQHTSENPAINKKIVACRAAFDKLLATYNTYRQAPTPKLKADGIKQKDLLLKSLTQLMKLSQASNDEPGMEEAADLRREVNKMEFKSLQQNKQQE